MQGICKMEDIEILGQNQSKIIFTFLNKQCTPIDDDYILRNTAVGRKSNMQSARRQLTVF